MVSALFSQPLFKMESLWFKHLDRCIPWEVVRNASCWAPLRLTNSETQAGAPPSPGEFLVLTGGTAGLVLGEATPSFPKSSGDSNVQRRLQNTWPSFHTEAFHLINNSADNMWIEVPCIIYFSSVKDCGCLLVNPLSLMSQAINLRYMWVETVLV